MQKRRYVREGIDVMKNGKFFAKAKDAVAAATIVLALEMGEGRNGDEATKS